MIMTKRPEPWEVWFANVRFEDDPTLSKSRPVLVISDHKVCILSLKITSKPPRNNFYGEYALLKWQEAGLDKQSTVRISKKLKLVERDFSYRIGRLAPIDILNVIKILKN